MYNIYDDSKTLSLQMEKDWKVSNVNTKGMLLIKLSKPAECRHREDLDVPDVSLSAAQGRGESMVVAWTF